MPFTESESERALRTAPTCSLSSYLRRSYSALKVESPAGPGESWVQILAPQYSHSVLPLLPGILGGGGGVGLI